MNVKRRSKLLVKDIVYIGMFTALQCIISGFSIPIGPISITIATFGLYIFSSLFPLRISFSIVILYILLGICGLPVFSNFQGGFSVILGVTGGYIIGYIPMVLIIGGLREIVKDRKKLYPLIMILATLVLYVVGSLHFFFVNNQATSLVRIIEICVLPFIPLDLLKIFISSVISSRLKPMVEKSLSL